MANVRASETKAMTARAAALRAEGKSIITLSQGEPDFETPEHVRAAGHNAIDRGFTRYTAVPGTLALREAIVAKLRRDNELTVTADQIVVGCGAKQVIFNALFASLDAGDEVVIPAPCWVSYPEMVRLAGGTPVIVSTVATGFKLTAEALKSAFGDRTKWLILNSPCNPTGVVYSAAELRALAEVLERWPNVWILSDDIYEKLVYDGTQFATMAAVAPALATRTLTVNGLSKSHAMTGWRVGYGAGPQEIVKAITLIQSQTTSHTSSISQHAAAEALNGNDGFLEQFREEYRVRRDIVLESLNAVPGLNALKPDGAFYVFVSCAGLIGARAPSGRLIQTDVDLVMYFLEEAGVAVVPGSGFRRHRSFAWSYASATRWIHAACVHRCRLPSPRTHRPTCRRALIRLRSARTFRRADSSAPWRRTVRCPPSW
jgi:aspartate aminotransferase